jgi:Mn2+/Fe2+ NRAMP family transporter
VQAGAQYGYGMLWPLTFTLPLMTAVQEASARIGLVTDQGLAAMMRKRYGAPFVVSAAALLGIANTINVGADIAGMAAAARLLVPLPQAILATAFALAILGLEVFVGYDRYNAILKWLALALLAYPLVALLTSVPWTTVLVATVVPHVSLNGGFVFVLTAVLGTTISPYLFFWEASQEVEDVEKVRQRRRRVSRIGLARRMRVDNAAGMVVSNVIGWFLIVVAATVLHAHGVTNIATAADAAKALAPLVNSFPHAGLVASGIFAAGIIGLGALAVPVLAGAASYAFAEAFDWRRGLDRKVGEAPRFYAVIAAAIIVGLAISFTRIDPIRLLVWSAVINGVVAVPMVVVVGRIAADRAVMGRLKSGTLSNVLIAVTAVAMGLCAAATLVALVITPR